LATEKANCKSKIKEETTRCDDLERIIEEEKLKLKKYETKFQEQEKAAYDEGSEVLYFVDKPEGKNYIKYFIPQI